VVATNIAETSLTIEVSVMPSQALINRCQGKQLPIRQSDILLSCQWQLASSSTSYCCCFVEGACFFSNGSGSDCSDILNAGFACLL
jgi:hypothetical protein